MYPGDWISTIIKNAASTAKAKHGNATLFGPQKKTITNTRHERSSPRKTALISPPTLRGARLRGSTPREIGGPQREMASRAQSLRFGEQSHRSRGVRFMVSISIRLRLVELSRSAADLEQISSQGRSTTT
jgi:hypothetical protein